MHIREFQMADFGAVVALWQASGLQLSATDDAPGLEEKLARDPELFLVGVDNGAIVGAVMGAYDGRRGWVYHLAIDSRWQGQGLGTVLLAQLEERLRNKGCRKVNLLVEPDNAGVRHFYEHLGYQCDSLIFMEKWLG